MIIKDAGHWVNHDQLDVFMSEYFTDDDGSPDTWLLITDRTKDRYPDLWRERERACDDYAYCEIINSPDPGEEQGR